VRSACGLVLPNAAYATIGCEELDWWDEHVIGSLRIAATPAMHFSSRGIGDRGDTLWCGFALGGDGAKWPARVFRR